MNFYRYDPHVHTSEGSWCATVSAEDMVRLYKDAGYQGIVVTNHFFEDYFKNPDYKSWKDIVDGFLLGYRKAVEAGSKIGLDVFFGMELKFTESFNDFLIYGIDENFILENPYLNRIGLKAFRELIQGTDILMFQAHPYRAWSEPADVKYLDGIEVYNGHPRHDNKDYNAYKLARENNLMMISGSDAHQPEDVGRGGIGLTKKVNSALELVTQKDTFLIFHS